MAYELHPIQTLKSRSIKRLIRDHCLRMNGTLQRNWAPTYSQNKIATSMVSVKFQVPFDYFASAFNLGLNVETMNQWHLQ